MQIPIQWVWGGIRDSACLTSARGRWRPWSMGEPWRIETAALSCKARAHKSQAHPNTCQPTWPVRPSAWPAFHHSLLLFLTANASRKALVLREEQTNFHEIKAEST